MQGRHRLNQWLDWQRALVSLQNGVMTMHDDKSRSRLRRARGAHAGVAVIAALLLALLSSCSGQADTLSATTRPPAARPATTPIAATSGPAPSPAAVAETPGPTSSSTAVPGAMATQTPAPSSGTQVQVFEPWTPAGTLSPSVHVTQRLSGTSCTMRSAFDVGNPHAWRCFQASGAFYDPCFAPAGRSNITMVACADSPWSGVAVITLSQPLARASWGTPNPAAAGHPWATFLANGQQCGLIEGTGQFVDSIALNFACGSGYASYPNTNTQPWTVSYAASRTSAVSAVRVTKAWA
jgi:hypothetical protein